MFITLDEVRAYLGEVKIQCLICGKKYKQLANHLRQKHGVDPDDYRKEHGIPWTWSLDCPSTREKKGIASKMKIERNSKIKENLDWRKCLKKKPKRKQCVAVLKQSSKNRTKYNESMGFTGETYKKRKAMPKRGSVQNFINVSRAQKKWRAEKKLLSQTTHKDNIRETMNDQAPDEKGT